jgi:hypothetical protein
MKTLLATLLLASALFGQSESKAPKVVTGNSAENVSATLIDGKCSICVKEGRKSTVTMDSYGSCTLLACSPGHYDEDGKWVAPPPCNTCSRSGKCSNGHSVSEITKQ